MIITIMACSWHFVQDRPHEWRLTSATFSSTLSCRLSVALVLHLLPFPLLLLLFSLLTLFLLLFCFFQYCFCYLICCSSFVPPTPAPAPDPPIAASLFPKKTSLSVTLPTGKVMRWFLALWFTSFLASCFMAASFFHLLVEWSHDPAGWTALPARSTQWNHLCEVDPIVWKPNRESQLLWKN